MFQVVEVFSLRLPFPSATGRRTASPTSAHHFVSQSLALGAISPLAVEAMWVPAVRRDLLCSFLKMSAGQVSYEEHSCACVLC
jgi:hypothetical protein